MPAPDPAPFAIDIPDEALHDLRARLGRVRWPDEIAGGGWRYGTDPHYLRNLVAYWRDGYDWRREERALNAFDHYRVPLAGIDLHYIHQPGRGPDPLPLLLTHGWPGSVLDFLRILPLLTDPVRHGGDARDAFTVVVPSMPGYGFSFRPGQPRFDLAAIADAEHALMTEVLGFERYASAGADYGAFVSTRLGYLYPQHVAGIHVSLLAIPREPSAAPPATEAEHAFAAQLEHWLAEESAYSHIMGTKPQTLAYALTDSPVGLAAWMVEKFYAWSDCDDDLDAHIGRDVLLTNVMIYWLTGAIGSSFWPYYQRRHGPWIVPAGERVMVPTGYAEFPREILTPPRSLAERIYGDIRRWTRMARGGHFPALEDPQALAAELRAFFRGLR